MVGAGGHGLSTAYHLARDHRLKVAVLERSLVGYGNVGLLAMGATLVTLVLVGRIRLLDAVAPAPVFPSAAPDT